MAAPIRVGVLNDMSAGPAGPTDIETWLRRAVDDVRCQGRLDRDVEFVNACGLGLPEGTAAAVEHAYAELAAADVLVIVGPAIGDNALVATPLAERYRIPTINWAGTERARSEYMFHLQVGSHEDESLVIVRFLASRGATRLGVVADRSPIGRRYLDFLRDEADVLGLRVTAVAEVSPLAEDATNELAEVLDSGLDALVYLGLGLAAPAVATAARDRGWDGLCAMNTCGLRGYEPSFGRVIDGWHYIDMVSDLNTTLAALRQRFGIDPRSGFAPSTGYDMGRLVAEGLARAPERTHDGVKEGLERVKWLPAAEGHEGSLLGFGTHDRGALHGRYLVVREWSAGASIEVT